MVEQSCNPGSREEIAAVVRSVLAGDEDVVLGYVFGSRATGLAHSSSDYDIGVLLRAGSDEVAKREGLAHCLRVALDCPRVDVVVLNRAPIELAYAVLAQGMDVFARSEAERIDFEANVLGRYGDYLPCLRQQFRELLERDEHDARVQRNRTALGRTLRTLGSLGAAVE